MTASWPSASATRNAMRPATEPLGSDLCSSPENRPERMTMRLPLREGVSACDWHDNRVDQTMNIETNAANIRKSIKAINTARTKLVDTIQQTAIAVINHAHVHGDVTLASDLCLAVGNGMKHEALRLYLSEFGPMAPNDDKETKAAM